MTYSDEFRSYLSAQQDYKLYLEAKGYQQQGSRTYWEPQSIADIEPEKNLGPGAMARGELDDYDFSDCEEF